MHYFPSLDYYTIRDVMSWRLISLLSASIPSYHTNTNTNTDTDTEDEKPGKKNKSKKEIKLKTKDQEIAALKEMGII